MKKLFTALIGILIMSTSSPTNTKAGEPVQRLGGDRGGDHFSSRSPVLAMNGAAATRHPLASQVAIDILKKGGSAVDAAIAANATLGLMTPVVNGIGGDIFVIVWDPKTKKLYGYNGSGRAPMGRTLAQMNEKVGNHTEGGFRTIPAYGSLPVTVPGVVDGWFAIHDKFGKLRMKKVLAPAIRYAEEGFAVTELIAPSWGRSMANFTSGEAPFLEEYENARATYMPGGKAPGVGDVFKNPDLARTYRLIGRKGRKAFYKGSIARTIDSYMKRIGGDMRYEDLSAHRGEWVEPVSVSYRGYDVYELPPNTQGIAALQMLNTLEAYDLKSMGHNSTQALHVMIEAKRLAFEDRAKFYYDPAFKDVPLSGLLSKAYADKRRALISSDKALKEVGAGDPHAIESGDTIYLTVADKNGMMVSLIQSNYRGMGSGLVADGLGFMFQDRGQLFSLEPDHPNAYAPGKRPFHTIIPAFLMKDGKPLMSFGVMGGAMQPQGHVQVLVNLLDHGMNVQEAGDAARFRHSGSTQPTGEPQKAAGTVSVEAGVPADVRAALAAMGHNVVVDTRASGYGAYHAIYRDPETGVYHAASEMRADGQAIGY
jgi:gamma-glutamyltranspeptidase / glutathione hydrolase